MIFLLGGRKNPAVRAVVGAVLLVAGIAIHGSAILVALGAVLIVWGGAQSLKKYRVVHEVNAVTDGRAS